MQRNYWLVCETYFYCNKAVLVKIPLPRIDQPLTHQGKGLLNIQFTSNDCSHYTNAKGVFGTYKLWKGME